MANKNTKYARANGFASLKDQQSNGTKVFSGGRCDTRWDNKNSKKRSRKIYKNNSQDY